MEEKQKNVSALEKELNRTKNQTELLKKEVDAKEIEFKNELAEQRVI